MQNVVGHIKVVLYGMAWSLALHRPYISSRRCCHLGSAGSLFVRPTQSPERWAALAWHQHVTCRVYGVLLPGNGKGILAFASHHVTVPSFHRTMAVGNVIVAGKQNTFCRWRLLGLPSSLLPRHCPSTLCFCCAWFIGVLSLWSWWANPWKERRTQRKTSTIWSLMVNLLLVIHLAFRADVLGRS